MTEKELEKKINLLFKVLINLEGEVYNPIFNYIEEYIPLFNLTSEVKYPEKIPTAEKYIEIVKKQEILMAELKKKYNDESISIKEHKEIEANINNQQERLELLKYKLDKRYKFLVIDMKDLREELLKLELMRKVGVELIKEEDHRHFYRKKEIEKRLRDIAKDIRRLWREYEKIGK